MCLRDPVVQVAVDHPETAGRGQGCVSVSHEWVFSGRWVVEELPSCGAGPTRLISAGASWQEPHDPQHLGSGRSDVYLHLYEHFLSSYDPALKQASGSYYTPVELVDAMVGWADEAVREHLGRPRGLRDSATSVIDPAMGTGTYPLSVLRRVGADAATEYGTAAAGEAVASMVGRLYGIELQSGPFSVAELRISQAVKEAGAQVPANGLRLFVADTLEDSAATAADEGLSWNAGLIAQQRIEANRVGRVNLSV
ncbi:N-6 DNA methylase [Micrococcus luteus]|uniref:N-6 DNA methylase n=1 Tax=Micrococcus luteus TaxID=1270 RepID=UPI003F813612